MSILIIKRYFNACLRYAYSQNIIKLPFVLINFFIDYFKIVKSKKKLNSNFEVNAHYPCLSDKTDSSGDFGRYVYQDSWAFNHIQKIKPKKLIDIGSSTYFVAFCAQLTKVQSVDIRILKQSMKSISSIRGDVTDLPFKSNSVEAISSLSVLEHIGLGRYGDKLNFNGMEVSIKEIIRVLKPKGIALVAFPVGSKNQIVFNAHRICTSEYVYSLFSDLILVEERYALRDRIISKTDYIKAGKPYSYGCFYFKKNS